MGTMSENVDSNGGRMARNVGSMASAGQGASMACALQGGVQVHGPDGDPTGTSVASLLESDKRRWHHRPAHRFVPNATYMITAATLHKRRFFVGDERLELLESALLDVFRDCDWRVQAWAVFSNHYHCIVEALGEAKPIKSVFQRLHSQTARELNRLDGAPGRRVWFQYWDTCLTFEDSYFARLRYVLTNPVRHGLVARAENYRYCSAGLFALHSDPAFRRKVESYGCDRLEIVDEF